MTPAEIRELRELHANAPAAGFIARLLNVAPNAREFFRVCARDIPALLDRIEELERALATIRELTDGPSFRMGDRICAVIDSAALPSPLKESTP